VNHLSNRSISETATLALDAGLPAVRGHARTHAGRMGAWLTASTLAALLLAGCGSGDAAEDPGAEAVAGGSEAAAPAARDRAPAPAPVAAIPAGSVLTFEVTEDVSTATHDEGARFSLNLVNQVQGEHGAVLPAGTSARGIVTRSRRSESSDDEALLAIRIASVEAGGAYRDVSGTVESTDLETGTRDSGQRTAAKVATGAAAGAVIGQILGRDTRSTVTGAAVGAAAGLGVALTTRDGHAVLPRGARVVVRLDAPLVMN
jgi:hypothetical protein